VGEKAIAGDLKLLQSTRDFDWLGAGIYFWEGDPIRAAEWAGQKVKRGDYKDPFVIGAVIDLGNCLDLMVRDNLELVRNSYVSFEKVQTAGGLPLPENKKAPKDNSDDLVMRYLDCAVMNHLHSIIETDKGTPGIEPFDTVRALFGEGEPLYAGSGFRAKTHSQIAVRSEACIKGVFQVR
jgi:hypothetical protein